MRHRVIVGILASGLVLGANALHNEPKKPVYGRTAAEYCAWVLGIDYSPAQGVTEQLEAFAECVRTD